MDVGVYQRKRGYFLTLKLTISICFVLSRSDFNIYIQCEDSGWKRYMRRIKTKINTPWNYSCREGNVFPVPAFYLVAI